MLKRLINYLKESAAELQKVTWPNRRQAVKLTGLVVVFSLIVAAFIGGIDWIFNEVIQKLILKI